MGTAGSVSRRQPLAQALCCRLVLPDQGSSVSVAAIPSTARRSFPAPVRDRARGRRLGAARPVAPGARAAWLAGLPGLLASLEADWLVTVGARLDGWTAVTPPTSPRR